MTEGSPIMSNTNLGNVAHPTGQAGAEVTPQEVVLIYAPMVPPQLEHWLRKRSMRLSKNTSVTVDANEVRSTGARFVFIDTDALPGSAQATETIRNLHAQVPEARIVAITHHGDEATVKSLQDAGASGVVIKQPYVADLVFSLQAAQEGRSFVSGVATDRERASVQITAREREVLELMANGHSNQAIGERLSISVKTVEAHRARLFKKLGASNVADAVLLAIRTGLVMP